MLIVMAVLCAALSGFVIHRVEPPATKRLLHQFASTSPRAKAPSAPPGDPSRRPPHPEERPETQPSPHLNRHRHPNDRLLRRATAVLVGVACAIVLGGVPGTVAGVLVAVAVSRSFNRLGQAERRRRDARRIADLPIAVDLLAACLRGGTPWSRAVEAVAEAVGGPLGEDLHKVAVHIRLGADPAVAWLALAEEPTLAPLARTAVRAVQSGAPPAVPLARLARDQRRTARSAAAARARTAGIKALLPLGACFLPAFVFLGIVPAIAGIASTLLVPW